MKKLRKTGLFLIGTVLILEFVALFPSCKDEPAAETKKPALFTVSFDLNGGIATGTIFPPIKQTSEGTAILLYASTGITHPQNKIFSGWNTEKNGLGQTLTAGSPYLPTSNIWLYASWTDPNQNYTITFNGNGQTSGNVPAQLSGTLNSSHTIPGNTGGLEKTGNVFNGWNTQSNGLGTTYAQGSTYTITTAANVTLWAKWDDVTTVVYTVAFSGNGHTGGNVPPPITQSSNGASITIPGNTGNLVRPYYLFGGWNTQANGSGVNYTASDSFTPTGPTILHVKWEANTAEAFTAYQQAVALIPPDFGDPYRVTNGYLWQAWVFFDKMINGGMEPETAELYDCNFLKGYTFEAVRRNLTSSTSPEDLIAETVKILERIAFAEYFGKFNEVVKTIPASGKQGLYSSASWSAMQAHLAPVDAEYTLSFRKPVTAGGSILESGIVTYEKVVMMRDAWTRIPNAIKMLVPEDNYNANEWNRDNYNFVIPTEFGKIDTWFGNIEVNFASAIPLTAGAKFVFYMSISNNNQIYLSSRDAIVSGGTTYASYGDGIICNPSNGSPGQRMVNEQKLTRNDAAMNPLFNATNGGGNISSIFFVNYKDMVGLIMGGARWGDGDDQRASWKSSMYNDGFALIPVFTNSGIPFEDSLRKIRLAQGPEIYFVELWVPK